MIFKKFVRRLVSDNSFKTLSSLDAYAQWAASYPPYAHNALMQTEQRAMLDLLPDVSGCMVLDLACGTGRYGLLALERGAKAALGLDNSPAMLGANGLQQRALATTEAIPLAGESIDVVVCGLALGHLPALGLSMREISRVLKPCGCALVSDFHPFLFLNGQRRTFTAPDGKTYAVEHYAHLYADYHRAAREAGLRIEQVVEPALVLEEENSLKSDVPVVIVYRLGKMAV